MASESSVDHRLSVLWRSQTQPLCEGCGYRMVPIDHCRDACRRCGEIIGNEIRSARYVALVFGGRIVIEVVQDGD